MHAPGLSAGCARRPRASFLCCRSLVIDLAWFLLLAASRLKPLEPSIHPSTHKKASGTCARKQHLRPLAPRQIRPSTKSQPWPRYWPSRLQTANPSPRRPSDSVLTASGKRLESRVGMACSSGWKLRRKHRRASSAPPRRNAPRFRHGESTMRCAIPGTRASSSRESSSRFAPRTPSSKARSRLIRLARPKPSMWSLKARSPAKSFSASIESMAMSEEAASPCPERNGRKTSTRNPPVTSNLLGSGRRREALHSKHSTAGESSCAALS